MAILKMKSKKTAMSETVLFCIALQLSNSCAYPRQSPAPVNCRNWTIIHDNSNKSFWKLYSRSWRPKGEEIFPKVPNYFSGNLNKMIVFMDPSAAKSRPLGRGQKCRFPWTSLSTGSRSWVYWTTQDTEFIEVRHQPRTDRGFRPGVAEGLISVRNPA
jgi:hypothetical protein